MGTTETHSSGIVYRSGTTGPGGGALSDNFILIGDHIVATTAHGVSGSIVGTSDAQTLTNKTIAAGSNTITGIADANIASGAAIDASKIANGSVSNSEFQYLDGVTSAIQTQLDTKAASSSLTSHLADTAAHSATSSAIANRIMMRSSANGVAVGVLDATSAVQTPVVGPNTSAWYVNGNGVHHQIIRLDQTAVYDERSLLTTAYNTSTSNGSEGLYGLYLSAGTHGWIEAIVSVYNSSSNIYAYLRKRWVVWYASTVSFSTHEVEDESIDPAVWGPSLTLDNPGTDTFTVTFTQPSAQNVNLSVTIRHKFDYPGSVASGGY